MALLGSIIIDQMIFKDDIELKKEEELVERVNKALPGKLTEINQEIIRLDSLIGTLEPWDCKFRSGNYNPGL